MRGRQAVAGDAQQSVTHAALLQHTPRLKKQEQRSAGSSSSNTVLACPSGHALQPHVAGAEGCFCDRCGAAGLPEGTRTMRCEACDYDVCAECSAAGGTRLVVGKDKLA